MARKHGVSEATLYNWKAKFGGMDVSEAKRLKQLEDEIAKLQNPVTNGVLALASARIGARVPTALRRARRLRTDRPSYEGRRFGYRRLFILLRREGEPSGINRIHRLYRGNSS